MLKAIKAIPLLEEKNSKFSTEKTEEYTKWKYFPKINFTYNPKKEILHIIPRMKIFMTKTIQSNQ